MARVKYSVPMVVQLQNPICWVACAAMILSWKRGQSVTIGSLLGGFDPSNSCISNPATTWQKMYDMLSSWGIASEGPQMCPASTYVAHILVSHGPFILTHYTSVLAPSVTGVGTHAVVVTGVDTDSGKAWYNNPWGTSDNEVDVNTILGAMETLWLKNLLSVAYNE